MFNQAHTHRASRRRHHGFTLVEIMIVVAIIGILVAIAVPGWLRAREKSQATACQTSQQQIRNSVVRWALDMRKTVGDTPTRDALIGRGKYIDSAPTCPGCGLEIVIPGVDEPASCPGNIPGHEIP